MSYDARAVANYFLDLAANEGRSLDPMGIEKLVYFAHGWHLAIFESPLVPQPVEAWQYGPVFRDLYQSFKEFGTSWIKRPAMANGVAPRIENSEDTKETRALLNRVWNIYKNYSSIQLSNLTHLPDSPWTITRENNETVIDNSLIEQYFKAQAFQNAAIAG
jgi:uncharacterized phage-associated protein